MKIAKRMVATVAVACAACVSGGANAGESADGYPFGVALLPVRYLETPGPDSGVDFFRLNLLAGCNRTTSGLDIGTVGNWTTADAYSLSLAAGYNVCGGDGGGVQVACVNFAERAYGGFQIGLVNMTWGIGGLQVGVVNATGEGRGLQLGVMNMAESFAGLQLGLMNMNQASALVMTPILNVWF